MAQARAALQKHKDVMQAAERIFDGSFDYLLDADGDVRMESGEAPQAASKARISRWKARTRKTTMTMMMIWRRSHDAFDVALWLITLIIWTQNHDSEHVQVLCIFMSHVLLYSMQSLMITNRVALV